MCSIVCRFQQLPHTSDVLGLEAGQDLVRNFLKVVSGQSQYGGAGSGKTDSKEARV